MVTANAAVGWQGRVVAALRALVSAFGLSFGALVSTAAGVAGCADSADRYCEEAVECRPRAMGREEGLDCAWDVEAAAVREKCLQAFRRHWQFSFEDDIRDLLASCVDCRWESFPPPSCDPDIGRRAGRRACESQCNRHEVYAAFRVIETDFSNIRPGPRIQCGPR